MAQMSVEDAIKTLSSSTRIKKVVQGTVSVPYTKYQNTVTVTVELDFKPTIVILWCPTPNLISGSSASTIITQAFPYVSSSYHSSMRITDSGFSLSGWNYDTNYQGGTVYYSALEVENLQLY